MLYCPGSMPSRSRISIVAWWIKLIALNDRGIIHIYYRRNKYCNGRVIALYLCEKLEKMRLMQCFLDLSSIPGVIASELIGK